jgi:hypothetical protein
MSLIAFLFFAFVPKYLGESGVLDGAEQNKKAAPV